VQRFFTELYKESIEPQGRGHQSSSSSSSSDGNQAFMLQTEGRFDFLDGFRGLLTLLVVYAHIAKFYSKLDLSSTTTLYMSIFVISAFFIQSSFLLTKKVLSDMFKIHEHEQHLSRNEKRRAMTLLIGTYFIRRTFRLYVPYFVVCTLVSYGPKFFGNFSRLCFMLIAGF
jgi:peptidoglycan/LPS O-acetylase OafA/YrhL